MSIWLSITQLSCNQRIIHHKYKIIVPVSASTYFCYFAFLWSCPYHICHFVIMLVPSAFYLNMIFLGVLSTLFGSCCFFCIIVKYLLWLTVEPWCHGDLSGGTLQGRVWLGDDGVEVDWQEMLLLSNCSQTVTATWRDIVTSDNQVSRKLILGKNLEGSCLAWTNNSRHDGGLPPLSFWISENCKTLSYLCWLGRWCSNTGCDRVGTELV